jgi:uncharacterized repeat protein (TIGR01451 family)
VAFAGVTKRLSRLFAAAVSLVLTAVPDASAAVLGAQVDNVATVTYTLGATASNTTTPPASFVIEAARTPSTIEFLRYSPHSPDAALVALNGSEFLDLATDAFRAVGPLTAAGGAPIDTTAPVRLIPAGAYFSGEPIIVKVTDRGQNGNPNVVESIVATIATANGDFVTLRFYESGPSTGEFYAWIPSNTGSPVQNDPVLTIVDGATLTARYQDPFDLTEVSTDTAGVDPFGRVFDSLTGALLDGVTVTVVDDATGLPAPVFGIDGVSIYPSTVVTGSTVTDGAGLVYNLGPGEFRFPIMMPGTYRVVVTPITGYAGPSSVQPPGFDALPGAPFTITPASYGAAFTLAGTSDLEFDVPLDPFTDILVSKTAGAASAGVGDFIRYEVTVENRGSAASAGRIVDSLPIGFRYKLGTARLDGAVMPDPVIAPSGESLVFDLGLIAPGATARLAYVIEVTPRVRPGAAVNRAQAVSAGGVPFSNRAEAAVEIVDEFLRSGFTILGRIIEDGCDIDEEGRASNLRAGKGLEGVRLYLETGATVVADEDGLYHFEAVKPGVHVVQVDEESLPDGYDLVQCKDDTRRASSPWSQFVDAQGGSLWRADFYVKRTAAVGAAPTVAPQKAAEPFNPDREYLAFGKDWLENQSSEPAFAYPAEGVTPSAPTVNIGVKHAVGLRPTLYVNGREARPENFDGREVSAGRTAAVSRWRGVDLLEGDNRIEAIIRDESGAEIARLARVVPYIDRVERVMALPEQTIAVADGKTAPRIAVRVTDGSGRPVRAGRLIAIEVSGDFRTSTRDEIEARDPLTAPLSSKSAATVGQNGVAIIELEPTVETGPVAIEIDLDDGRTKTINAYVRPAPRDFIVVGLATGEAALEKKHGAGASPRDLIADGRIAGFAKGAVKGDWLVTIAGDSAKNDRDEEELLEVVDPDERYPLYGDRSNQEFEAQSRYPVYIKAEKDAFQATFGDFDTGMNRSELSRYSRRLSGLQSVYDGERFGFTAFAAEIGDIFVRDERAADGTSGPYRLSAAPLLRNSESIVIETRDRFRPDQVIASTTLIRYADYDIDYETGEIILRLPAPAADAAFNPNVLVIDYETETPVERNLTAGGRASAKLMQGRAEIGGTFIHEEAPGATGEETNLAGVDFRADLDDATEVRLEYARTMRDAPGVDEFGQAYLAEINHTGERVAAEAYFSEAQPGFGLGQQTTATAGVRRIGAKGAVKLDEFVSRDGEARGQRYLDAEAYRETNLTTDAARTIAEVALRQESDRTSGRVGLRAVHEDPEAGPDREGLFVTASARQRFNDLGLSLRAAHEQPVSGDNASTLFPRRTSLGFDQRLFDGFTLSATHEILSSEAISQSNTTIGLVAEPWSGGKITVSGDRLSQDSSERLGATFAADQQVKIDDAWTASFGMARREDLGGSGSVDRVDDIVPDAPLSPFEEVSENFTSLYAGLGYRKGPTTGSTRAEMKKSATGQRYMVVAGAAREMSEELSFAAVGRFQQDNNETTADERRFDARLGASWRPRDDGMIILNRLDLKQAEIDQTSKSWKAVHNFALNAMATERLQLAFNHGLKYATLTTGGATTSGVTQLAGFEARYDVTRRIDIGFHGEAIYSWDSKTTDYSYGPSVGFTPADNVWLSVGWNFAGFIDEDFAAAEYSRIGPYLRLRIKFDQTTAKGLLDAISPDRAP